MSFKGLLRTHADLLPLKDLVPAVKKKMEEITTHLGIWIQDPNAPKDLRKKCYDLLFGEPEAIEEQISDQNMSLD
jgi:hypothetical protein